MPREKIEAFLDHSSEIASYISSRLERDIRVKINTDTDPDGVSAGNILARCLNYYDVPFHISFGGPPDSRDVEELGRQDYDLFFFLDQGTGQFDMIDEFLLEEEKDVVILDHHPGEVEEKQNLAFLNPHKFGLNGSEDVSAAGITYQVVEEFDERFYPLSELALVGAVGDRQEVSEGFTGINEIILSQALESDYLNVREGLKISGRTETLLESLFSSINPYLPGLSGDKDACGDFLEEIEFDPESCLEELEVEDEKVLYEEILDWIDVEETEQLGRSLWGKIYTSEISQAVGPKIIHEYVRMLVACEKLDQIPVGFSALLGDDSYRQKAFEYLDKYRNKMLEVFRKIESGEEIIRDTSKMRYLDLEDRVNSNLAGEVGSISIESGLVNPEKPFLVLVESGGDRLKISARADLDSLEGSVDLGSVMSEAAEEFGGSGGGHDVAAAARLPVEVKGEFVDKVNRLLEGSG